MFTTAGLMRSTTSAKLTRVPGTAPCETRAGAADRFGPTVSRAEPDDGGPRPARIAPPRTAPTAVSATVTKVNRRDIIPSPGPRRTSLLGPPGRNGRALHSL